MPSCLSGDPIFLKRACMPVQTYGRDLTSLEPSLSTCVRRIATLTFIIESGPEKYALIFPGPLEKRKAFMKEFEAACERWEQRCDDVAWPGSVDCNFLCVSLAQSYFTMPANRRNTMCLCTCSCASAYVQHISWVKSVMIMMITWCVPVSVWNHSRHQVLHAPFCMCACMYVCMYIFMYVCMYVYMYLYMYV
jgi:hypothetical protein